MLINNLIKFIICIYIYIYFEDVNFDNWQLYHSSIPYIYVNFDNWQLYHSSIPYIYVNFDNWQLYHSSIPYIYF